MSAVKIADFKSRLSEHLRSVRAGRTLTILDRETPIARVVPWRDRDAGLRSRPPLASAPKLGRIKLPAPLPIGRDVVELLLEERQRER